MLMAERLTVADCAALFHPRWKRNKVFPEHTMKKVCSQATRDRLLAGAGPPQGHLEREALESTPSSSTAAPVAFEEAAADVPAPLDAEPGM